jgi:hypothetical protein
MGEQDTRGTPPGAESDADRAAREAGLKGRAEPETNESRQMQAEEQGSTVPKRGEERRLSGDEGLRELARLSQLHGPGTEQAQADYDRLRIGLGDTDHEAHVLLRNLRRAEQDFGGIGGSPAGSVALSKQIEDARKAVDANPIAKARLAKIEKARRRNEPVDFTEED